MKLQFLFLLYNLLANLIASGEISIPVNYFPNDNINEEPINRWRPYAFLLFTNFINEVYQDVPFDFCTPKN